MTASNPRARTGSLALASFLCVASTSPRVLASPSSDTADDDAAPAERPLDDGAAEPTGESVTIHVIDPDPDGNVGTLKLVRHVQTTTAQGVGLTVVTRHYEEVCRGTCDVPVDVTERPRLYLMRDEQVVSPSFHVPRGSSEITVKFKPMRPGMWVGGLMLTCLLVLPVGIPLLVLGKSKLWIANGTPSDHQKFVRVRS